MDKPKLHMVMLSGGKDSTAMLLMMLDKQMPIDIIIFCDTGLEFPAIYKHLDRLERDISRTITRVKAEHPFEYYMFDVPVHRLHETKFIQKYGLNHSGYGWAGPKTRWCTDALKNNPKRRFLRSLRDNYDIVEYVGIAADEQYRLERRCNKAPGHRHPLVEWGITEAECLQYCYDRGYDWDGLYQHFNRVSCWCCPLQSLADLRILRKYYPDLWEQLRTWDKQCWKNFRADYSVEQLEIRFCYEEECLAQGIPIKGKAFFAALKERL